MAKNIGDLAEHINNLFNISNPELVDAPNLTREDVHKLKDTLEKNYPRRYLTGISIETEGKKDVYTLSVRRAQNA
jgi:hypothetical protein